MILAAILVGALLWNKNTIMSLFKLATRGKRLTNAAVDSTGKIPVSPGALLAQAETALGRRIHPNAFALAKMFASEGPRDSGKMREARGWVAYNDLKSLEKRIGWKDFTRMFTFSTRADQNGFFGQQNKGRRYGTSKDVYEGHVLDAEALIRAFEVGPDPTRGATKFVDEGSLGGVQKGTEGNTVKSLEKDWGLKARLVANGLYIFGGKAA